MGATAATRIPRPGPLELRKLPDGAAHFLDGERVNQGAPLELRLTGGRWLPGRYEWSGHPARWAAFRVELGGPWESAPDEGPLPAAVLALHPDAILRRSID